MRGADRRAADAHGGLHAAFAIEQHTRRHRAGAGGRRRGRGFARHLPVAEVALGQGHRFFFANAAGDHKQCIFGTQAAGMFGHQRVAVHRFDAGLGGLRARIRMLAVQRRQHGPLGAKARLGLGRLQALQGIGLGQADFVLGEAGAAGDFGQQRRHVGGLGRQRVGIHHQAVVAGIGADTAAHALGRFGDLARTAIGGALGHQAGQHGRKGRRVRGIGSEAGVAEGQHVVYARHAVARHHPDLQAIVEGAPRHVGHGQRLVGRERRQFGRQRDGLGGKGQRRERGGHQQGGQGFTKAHGLTPCRCRWRPLQASRRACGRSRCGSPP